MFGVNYMKKLKSTDAYRWNEWEKELIKLHFNSLIRNWNVIWCV